MQALHRLITILELVAANRAPSGAAEVAVKMGLPLSTVARLMRQLADEGLLHRSSRDGRFTLGPRLYALARAATSQLDIAELARPIMEELRDVTGETTSLHVLRGTQRVCIAEVQSHHELRRVVPAGLPQPLEGTATGEVLLAGSPAPERQAAIDASGLSARERAALEERLERTRAEGYALADDWVDGLTGISVAVRDSEVTVAALSVSGPSSRFNREVAMGHLAATREAARLLSARLGEADLGHRFHGKAPPAAWPANEMPTIAEIAS